MTGAAQILLSYGPAVCLLAVPLCGFSRGSVCKQRFALLFEWLVLWLFSPVPSVARYTYLLVPKIVGACDSQYNPLIFARSSMSYGCSLYIFGRGGQAVAVCILV